MARIPIHKSTCNVFRDIGFTHAEAAELTAKSMLITAIGETIKRRRLTQREAARRCGIDQPTLSKVLRGRMESVTIRPAYGLAYRARPHRRNSRAPLRRQGKNRPPHRRPVR